MTGNDDLLPSPRPWRLEERLSEMLWQVIDRQGLVVAECDRPEDARLIVELENRGSPLLFLAVYDSQSGMAQLNNVGIISALDAQAARARACKLFNVAANCASSIYIKPMSEVRDGWSFYE